MTNQASEDELNKTVERLLRFNCPNGCDGNGSYPEMSADGEWEQGQCQWCFEYGMPARDAIQSLIRTEKLKLLAEVREHTTIFKIKAHDRRGQPHLYEAGRGVPTEVLTKLEEKL